MNRKERIRALRDSEGISLFEAVRRIDKADLHESIDAATTMDDVKAILRQIVDTAWFP